MVSIFEKLSTPTGTYIIFLFFLFYSMIFGGIDWYLLVYQYHILFKTSNGPVFKP